MNKYTYPAIFKQEDGGSSVSFSDLPDCLTCSDNLDDALYMAEDVLRGFWEWLEADKESFPKPSGSADLNTPEGGFVTLVSAWMYPRHEKKSVKKILTIPKWLNDEAVERGVNFSQVLQKELKEIVTIRV